MQSLVANQAYIFLYSIAGGMVIAFIYDIFRIKRKTIKTSTAIAYIEDVVYWLIVSFIMFMLLYFSNDGEIRGYIFIGNILGVVLYILLLSRAVMGMLLFAIKVLKKILRVIFRFICMPLILIFRVLQKPVSYVAKLLQRFFKRLRRIYKSRIDIMRMKGRIFKNMRKKI